MTRLLPVLLLAALVGCTPFEEPTGTPDLPASVVGTDPEDDENNVPGTTEVIVEFDRVPKDVAITVRPRTGTDVAGTVLGNENEVVRRFVPDEPFSPDVDWVVDVTWASGSLRFEFETSLLGFPLDDGDLEELPEMAWAVIIEPFGDLSNVPGLPQGQDLALLMAVQEDSALDEGFIDLVVAPTVAGTQLQDQCQETTTITAGPDGVLGTEDDRPGIWDNPRITASGDRFGAGDLGGLGGNLQLKDWVLDASVLPDRQGLFVHSLTLHSSTWALDGLIPSDGPFGGDSFCDVFPEFGGSECVRCPTGTREDKCLRIELTDYEGQTRASSIRERTCVDIIDSHFIGVICDGSDAQYDEDGDGVYELCPEWHDEQQ
ncbi:MAG: hypothetical protein KDA24_08940 [Deltaproteobacteria bacterium]|nr:hypothetical protein [Deltaproteobacteria bacterium]